MKKIVIVIIILITGCSNVTTKECSYEINDINLKTSTVYEIKYDNNKVKKYSNKTTYTFENKDAIKNINIELEKYKDLKYYKKSVKVNDNSLIIETSIDFDKIDLKQFKEIEDEEHTMYHVVEDLKVSPNELLSNMTNETCRIK